MQETIFFLKQYLRKSGALEIMFSKSANPSFPSPSMSASSITFSQTRVISSAVSSSRVSLLRVFSKSDLQMKLSVLKSKQEKNQRKGHQQVSYSFASNKNSTQKHPDTVP